MLYTLLLYTKRPGTVICAGAPDCQKSLAEFAPAGANKVKIIFSGGKWVRLQERAARLAKSNPCSAYVGENTLRPASVEFLR